MNPAVQNEALDVEERAAAPRDSRPPSRRSAEIDSYRETAIDVMAAADAEKKEPIGDETREVGKADKLDEKELDAAGTGIVVDEIDYPSGLRLALLTVGLCLVIFVVSALRVATSVASDES